MQHDGYCPECGCDNLTITDTYDESEQYYFMCETYYQCDECNARFMYREISQGKLITLQRTKPEDRNE